MPKDRARDDLKQVITGKDKTGENASRRAGLRSLAQRVQGKTNNSDSDKAAKDRANQRVSPEVQAERNRLLKEGLDAAEQGKHFIPPPPPLPQKGDIDGASGQNQINRDGFNAPFTVALQEKQSGSADHRNSEQTDQIQPKEPEDVRPSSPQPSKRNK